MNFKGRTLLPVLAILTTATLCFAETVFEQFKPDSTLTKVVEPNSSASFTYSPEGYVACTVRRSNLGGTAAKYYKPLSQKYYMPDINNIATTTDLWFGFDFKYDPGSAGVAAGYIGIFNSAASNTTVSPAQLNCIGLMPYDLDKFTLRAEKNAANGTSSLTETGLGSVINAADSFRCKVHVYMSGNDSLADVTIYSVNSSNQTTLVSSLTGANIAVGTNFWSGVNAIGVRNIAGSDSTSKSVFYVDNMYFSTTGEMANASIPTPNWLIPDDPTTLTVDDLYFSQSFRPDPVVDNDWSMIYQDLSGSGFGYDPNGFYLCATRRKSDDNSVAALYKPLGLKLYEPFNSNGFKFWSADEIWYGFDYQYVSGTTAATFTIGLFNSESTNKVGQNCLGLEFHSYTTVAMRIIGNTTWANIYMIEPTAGSYSQTYGSYRFYVKIYADKLADKTFADVECYRFDEFGTLSATPEFITTGILVADGTLGSPQKFLNGFDWFGVRNNSGANSTATRFNVDNMYISTEGTKEFPPPSWLISDADLNHDKVVNILDLSVMAANWLSDINLNGDINNSGRVEFVDFGMFADIWAQ
ncbi:MAG: hypothetical protein A2Y12_09100 [Planctomycetes bacterium GWF2_42_9]|nr:MAG: hypothetical protein A2Y12_09100 [Planctomycetes bacterium GWF2_42_9]